MLFSANVSPFEARKASTSPPRSFATPVERERRGTSASAWTRRTRRHLPRCPPWRAPAGDPHRDHAGARVSRSGGGQAEIITSRKTGTHAGADGIPWWSISRKSTSAPSRRKSAPAQAPRVKRVHHGTGRVRLSRNTHPVCGSSAYRTEFLADTRGTGSQIRSRWDEWQGDIAHRQNGALVADRRQDRTTGYATDNLQARGVRFLGPASRCTRAWWVGGNSRDNDLTSTHQGKEADQNARVHLGRRREAQAAAHQDLEQCLEWIREDELIEVTPKIPSPAQARRGGPPPV